MIFMSPEQNQQQSCLFLKVNLSQDDDLDTYYIFMSKGQYFNVRSTYQSIVSAEKNIP